MAVEPDALTIRIDRRARRISLRIGHDGSPILTLPHQRLKAEGLRFARKKQAWIAREKARRPDRVPFALGETIPVNGVAHRITLATDTQVLVQAADGVLAVAGNADAVPKLVQTWLQREARTGLTSAVEHFSAVLEVPAPPLGLRDPKTRWGSCSSRRRLSFSWRLVMAPRPVLDYVAAHEVAHLLELNHSARFWQLVAALMPDYQEQETWLKHHGRGLHRYG